MKSKYALVRWVPPSEPGYFTEGIAQWSVREKEFGWSAVWDLSVPLSVNYYDCYQDTLISIDDPYWTIVPLVPL